MKTVSFIVKLASNSIECVLNRKYSKCLAHTESIVAGTNNGKTIQRPITPHQLVYVLKEFNLLKQFRQRVYRFLRALNQNIIFHVVEPNNGGLIDYAWCRRALILTWEKVEIENLMSWLSTLGGAFSALGDSFEICAERAGRISMYQMKLGLRSGDPSIISRCKLYYSISLIQKGRLRAAKNLILKQYEYAKEEKQTGDERLYKMCHGIWLKLQYSYTLKRQKRQQNNHG